MDCRPNCGACCIAISISSSIPGMPDGKPAGVRCIHLTGEFRCSIYDSRPDVCRRFLPEEAFCGSSREEAMDILTRLETGMSGG